MARTRGRSRRLVLPLLLALLLAACDGASSDEPAEEPTVVIETPPDDACRVLTPQDAQAGSNDTEIVDCDEEHTARTIVVDEFPAALADAAHTDPRLGQHVYDVCDRRFARVVGGDESVRMRSLLSWVWFRPSAPAWEAGARWFRCDVVGGTDTADTYRPLPATLTKILDDQPADWMACVRGPQVAGGPRIPCSQPHDWRAATTIRLGRADDPYPGDRLAEVRTRDYCRSSISAWLDYPDSYEFGFTWFGRAEWEVGNRRSICWARVEP